MRTYKLYFIRHGLTQANVEGRYAGSTDIDLNEEGAAEIIELSQKYEYPNVGRVYSSPLKRALQTARLIYPEITPITVNGIREYDFGEFENKTISEIKSDPRFKEWFSGQPASETVFSVGEDTHKFQQRIIDGLNDIIMDMMKDKVSEAAIVSHGGVIMTLLAACGLPRQEMTKWSVDNGMGYTALVNASLWGNTRTFEVFTPIPYGINRDAVNLDYQRVFFDDGDYDVNYNEDGE